MNEHVLFVFPGSSIDKGDPTAIYKSGSQIGTFLGITINNIRVALLAFAFVAIFFLILAYEDWNKVKIKSRKVAEIENGEVRNEYPLKTH